MGFDPLDLLIARTSLAGENVKLLDLSVLDFNGSNNYYLQLINSGGMNATYGIAIEVPEPGRDDAALIAAMHSLARRTHRGRTCGVLCLK